VIAHTISMDLSTDYLLADRDINVDVHNGDVTLSGTVETPYERQRSEAVERRALGASEVVDNLALSGQAAYTDAALADHVESRMADPVDLLLVALKVALKEEMRQRSDQWKGVLQ
jgi:Flp pilus assembly secretin CpaC